MLRKSFLNESDLIEAEKLLFPPLNLTKRPLKGDKSLNLQFSCYAFSKWLFLKLENVLRDFPEWSLSHPIALGSWARGELSPKSDLDLIFCGEESHVLSLVDKLNLSGLKVRYRVPKNFDDWTEGVESFDIFALLEAKPFTQQGADFLIKQQSLIYSKGKRFFNFLLNDLFKERNKRKFRYNVMANFLEPNIKYSPGGLRDIDQGMKIINLFKERFDNSEKIIDVLNFYKAFFLTTRHKMHLLGAREILVKDLQKDLTNWFGYDCEIDYMREIQKGQNLVCFYLEYIFEQAKSSKKNISKSDRIKINSLEDCFRHLKNDSSYLMQFRVKNKLNKIINKKIQKKYIGIILKKYLNINKINCKFINAIFSCGLIDKCIPQIAQLRGLVQHDQYHRFTVIAHTIHSINEVINLYNNNNKIRFFKKYLKNFTSFDWKILLWTALYHDLGKGSNNDHCLEGAKIVQKDLNFFKFSKDFVEEVKWMVRNHLLVSHSAFRKNPRSPHTWKDLLAKKAIGKRLIRLVVFTIIDIRSSNIEAWNSWKERLLLDLLETMNSEPTGNFINLIKKAEEEKIVLDKNFVSHLDLNVLQEIPIKKLISDYKKIIKAKKSLPPLIVKDKTKDIWIRFHQKEDQKGVLATFVYHLYRIGCRIEHSLIETIPKYGVYDWFKIRTNKSLPYLKKMLLLPIEKNISNLPEVKFDKIFLVSKSDDEIILCFKAVDQMGLLAVAAYKLYQQDIEIKWASVHTWGRRVEDIFGIKPKENIGKIIENIEKM